MARPVFAPLRYEYINYAKDGEIIVNKSTGDVFIQDGTVPKSKTTELTNRVTNIRNFLRSYIGDGIFEEGTLLYTNGIFSINSEKIMIDGNIITINSMELSSQSGDEIFIGMKYNSENYEDIIVDIYKTNTDPDTLYLKLGYIDGGSFIRTVRKISSSLPYVMSEVQPTLNLINGVIWFNPATYEIRQYFNGKFIDLGNSNYKKILIYRNSTYMVTGNTNMVPIGIDTYDVSKDLLFVFQNGVFIHEGVNYRISNDSKFIENIKGDWTYPAEINFISISNVQKDADILTMYKIPYVVTATDNMTSIPIAHPNYNPKYDAVQVYYKNVILYDGVDYTLTEDKLTANLGFTLVPGEQIYFEIWKRMRYEGGTVDGTLIEVDSITVDKLKIEIQEKIAKIGTGTITGGESVVSTINSILISLSTITADANGHISDNSIHVTQEYKNNMVTSINNINTAIGEINQSIYDINSELNTVGESILTINTNINSLSNNKVSKSGDNYTGIHNLTEAIMSWSRDSDFAKFSFIDFGTDNDCLVLDFGDNPATDFFRIRFIDQSNAITNIVDFKSDKVECYVPMLGGVYTLDYAECRQSKFNIEPGRVVVEDGNGYVNMSEKRLQKLGYIVSDTFGHLIGKRDIENEYSVPIGLCGKVLAYIDNNKYKVGDCVCTGKNGTVSKMKWWEKILFPDRILGVISEIPKYEKWDKIEIKNRIWINLK